MLICIITVLIYIPTNSVQGRSFFASHSHHSLPSVLLLMTILFRATWYIIVLFLLMVVLICISLLIAAGY
jgi:hypothetical protein